MRKASIMAVALAAVILLIPYAALADTEIILDNPSAAMVGTWNTGTATTTKYGSDYYWCYISTSGGNSATYTPTIPTTASNWQVYTWYPSGTNRTTQAQYIIHGTNGDSTVYVNQQQNGGSWQSLGSYAMTAGTSNYVRITNYGSETTKVVMADGVRFLLPSPDTTPPTISGIVSSPGATTALISWTTNEPATSQVEYGLTGSYGSQTVKDSALTLNHSVSLWGLNAQTLYHFRVKSEDAAGNPAVSGDGTFTTGDSVAGELRACWINTWGNSILSAAQNSNLVNTLAAANYNVVIPEVRKCGDAYYNSAYEPRASNIIDPLPFDPLQDLVTKAHAQNIKVYGWLVTYRIWDSGWGAAPSYHIWAQHPEWVMKNSSGGILDGTKYNLDPGIPSVQDYVCKVVVDLASKYDIDGINWDYIRYPGVSWGYNDITKERFRLEYGYYPPTSDNGAQWTTWCNYRRQQVTDLVKKCHLELMAIKPHLNHTVCSVGWEGPDPSINYEGTPQYKNVFQDAKSWMQQHIIDTNILMNYKREHDAIQQPDYDVWVHFLSGVNRSTGRWGVNGQGVYLNTINNSVHQMQVARSAGVGQCTYDFASTNNESRPASDFFNAIETNLYQNPVEVPEMTWKTAPTTGTIFGTVTDAAEPNDAIYKNWVYKATVTVDGPVHQSTATDATGTYGFLDLPPGTYSISVAKSGFVTRTYTAQVLAAGQVLREDFDLGTTTVSSPAGVVVNGWSLLSLPYEPVNPDPAVVFNGVDIECRLYKWDNLTQGLGIYDSWSAETFGSMNVENGYWLQGAATGTISYLANAGVPASRAISLPSAGWAIIGCPFPTDKQWPNTAVKHGTETASMLVASHTNNWLNSTGYWWDSSTQGLMEIGLPEDFSTWETLQPWHGYWVQTSVDDVTLTVR